MLLYFIYIIVIYTLYICLIKCKENLRGTFLFYFLLETAIRVAAWWKLGVLYLFSSNLIRRRVPSSAYSHIISLVSDSVQKWCILFHTHTGSSRQVFQRAFLGLKLFKKNWFPKNLEPRERLTFLNTQKLSHYNERGFENLITLPRIQFNCCEVFRQFTELRSLKVNQNENFVSKKIMPESLVYYND